MALMSCLCSAKSPSMLIFARLDSLHYVVLDARKAPAQMMQLLSSEQNSFCGSRTVSIVAYVHGAPPNSSSIRPIMLHVHQPGASGLCLRWCRSPGAQCLAPPSNSSSFSADAFFSDASSTKT